MKILLRILITLVLFEIILGYTFYLKDSSKLTGNYISSTLRVLNKIKSKDPNKENENIKLIEKNFFDLTCQEIKNFNQVLQVADMNFYRRAIKFQTNLSFLNDANLENKFIIFIAGNSETFGYYQEQQKRIHLILQKKLNNKFSSKDIYVLNIADEGQLINDHIKTVNNFSKLYKPDLVIFYTGGNEIKIPHFFKDMVNADNSLNIKNEHWYSLFKNKSNEYQKCLNERIFLTKNNYKKEHPSLDIPSYIKKGFYKIKSSLIKKNIDFIFYIHPFNNKIVGDELLRLNFKKLQNINIADEEFINLSNKKLNLEFLDNFHTKDSKLISNRIFNDILIKYKKKIYNKIHKKNN